MSTLLILLLCHIASYSSMTSPDVWSSLHASTQTLELEDKVFPSRRASADTRRPPFSRHVKHTGSIKSNINSSSVLVLSSPTNYNGNTAGCVCV